MPPSLSCKEANRLGVFLSNVRKQNLRINYSKIIEKAKLHGEYVKRFNFWFDCYVVIKTALQAFTGKDKEEGKNEELITVFTTNNIKCRLGAKNKYNINDLRWK